MTFSATPVRKKHPDQDLCQLMTLSDSHVVVVDEFSSALVGFVLNRGTSGPHFRTALASACLLGLRFTRVDLHLQTWVRYHLAFLHKNCFARQLTRVGHMYKASSTRRTVCSPSLFFSCSLSLQNIMGHHRLWSHGTCPGKASPSRSRPCFSSRGSDVKRSASGLRS